MGFFDMFRRTPGISASEVRRYIQEKSPDEYCLLDVRQPSEYRDGHLPGAVLIPIGRFADGIRELDSARTTIVYCRTGSRSHSAAALLLAHNFREVLNMEGGIVRYNGIVASGPPEAGVFCFPDTLDPSQLPAVAWFLENGTLSFIDEISAVIEPESTRRILGSAAEIRSSHKEKLLRLYQEITGQSPAADFPDGLLDLPAEAVMIGCVKVADAITWAGGKNPTDILELLISLSANAYDLYLKLGRKAASEDAARVFMSLAKEEQSNINELAKAFEGLL